jgi:conjugal transfer pilus assembly protein TraD
VTEVQDSSGARAVLGLSVAVVAVALAPAVVAGALAGEALRAARLRWTWAAVTLPLVGLPLALAPNGRWQALEASIHVLRERPLLAARAAVPFWLALAPVVACAWKLSRDRRDRYHGGEHERRAVDAVGPLTALRRWSRRRTARRAGPRTSAGIYVGLDVHGEPVYSPPLIAHATIVGGSNTGKTNTLAVLLEGEAVAGRGFVIADGKGGRDLPRVALELGRRYSRPVAVWSIDRYGDQELDELRFAWNVCGDGNPTEVKDRIATAEEQSEPYYKAIAARGVLAACQALQATGRELRLDELAALLEQPSILKRQLAAATGDQLAQSAAAWLDALTEGERSGLRGMGLRLQTMVASEGGNVLLPDPNDREISLYRAFREGWFVVFSLPQGSYPNLVPHVTRYIIQAVNAVATRLEREGRHACALFAVDELSAFEGDQLAATLERARSAGIPVLLATQSLSNFESAGDVKLLHGALDNSELLVIHRQKVPESAELLASVAGTEETWEHTSKVQGGLGYHLGLDETGTRARRLTDRFRVHPNTVKALRLGEAIVITDRPTRTVRHVRVRPGITAQLSARAA